MNSIGNGGASKQKTFPCRLFDALEFCEKAGLEAIASWLPDGRSFKVHRRGDFLVHILPRYFHQSHYPSFVRQLNNYGFQRAKSGSKMGSYSHEYFVRGKRELLKKVVRIAAKQYPEKLSMTEKSSQDDAVESNSSPVEHDSIVDDSSDAKIRATRDVASSQVHAAIRHGPSLKHSAGLEYDWSSDFQSKQQGQSEKHFAVSEHRRLSDEYSKQPGRPLELLAGPEHYRLNYAQRQQQEGVSLGQFIGSEYQWWHDTQSKESTAGFSMTHRKDELEEIPVTFRDRTLLDEAEYVDWEKVFDQKSHST